MPMSGESVEHPAKYYQNNVAGSISLLEAMRRHGCRNIIFSSSCTTYGIPLQVPIPESHPQLPINPYGRSKLMVEQIIQDYGSAYGIGYAILRYFNAAGADPEGQIGEDHDPETHLFPILLQTVQGRRPYTEVYGTDYDTPDGTAIRDYIHVTDLADAHVLALRISGPNPSKLVHEPGDGTGALCDGSHPGSRAGHGKARAPIELSGGAPATPRRWSQRQTMPIRAGLEARVQ